MRYLLFVLPLALIMMTGCSKPDRELINGTWSYAEIREGKKVTYSSDKQEMDKILNNIVKEQGPMYAQMGIDEKMLRSQLETMMKNQGKATFVFTEKDKLTVAANSGDKSTDVTMSFKLDDKKKEVKLTENGQVNIFKYEIDGDKLTLKQDKNEIDLIRKD